MNYKRKYGNEVGKINLTSLRKTDDKIDTSSKTSNVSKSKPLNSKIIQMKASSNKIENKEELFKQIFNENYETLRNYIYYKFGNLEKANDIMQDSFMKLWDNFEEVPYHKAKGYVFILAKNAYLNYIKRQKTILKYNNSINDKLLCYRSPEHILEEKQFLNKINLIVSSLPVKQREVFLLNRIDGKTYGEIAEILEVSIKTVEQRMHKALLVTREKIGNI